MTNNNIALNNIKLNMPNLPASPTSFFTWDGTKITGLTYDGKQQEYIILPKKTTELGINVFKESKIVKLVDMSHTKITSMPICGGSYGGDTLFNNSSVELVILPNNLIDMGQKVFFDSYNLKEVIIPDTVTNMSGDNLFSYTNNLRSINIPKNVQGSLGKGSFYNSAITSITIPSGITTLEENALDSIVSLEKINLTNGLTTIKKGAIKIVHICLK